MITRVKPGSRYDDRRSFRNVYMYVRNVRLDSGSNRTVAYNTIRNEGLSSYREPAFTGRSVVAVRTYQFVNVAERQSLFCHQSSDGGGSPYQHIHTIDEGHHSLEVAAAQSHTHVQLPYSGTFSLG